MRKQPTESDIKAVAEVIKNKELSCSGNILPFAILEGESYICLGFNTYYKNWSQFGGGCKDFPKKECDKIDADKVFECAKREFEEETRKNLQIDDILYTYTFPLYDSEGKVADSLSMAFNNSSYQDIAYGIREFNDEKKTEKFLYEIEKNRIAELYPITDYNIRKQINIKYRQMVKSYSEVEKLKMFNVKSDDFKNSLNATFQYMLDNRKDFERLRYHRFLYKFLGDFIEQSRPSLEKYEILNPVLIVGLRILLERIIDQVIPNITILCIVLDWFLVEIWQTAHDEEE